MPPGAESVPPINTFEALAEKPPFARIMTSMPSGINKSPFLLSRKRLPKPPPPLSHQEELSANWLADIVGKVLPDVTMTLGAAGDVLKYEKTSVLFSNRSSAWKFIESADISAGSPNCLGPVIVCPIRFASITIDGAVKLNAPPSAPCI